MIEPRTYGNVFFTLIILSLLFSAVTLLGGCERRVRRGGDSSVDPSLDPIAAPGTRDRSMGPTGRLRAESPSATRPAATRPAPMRPERTLDFDYNDRELLAAGQRHGGRVWVPRHRRRQKRVARLPMVVVMHGVDKAGSSRPHRLLEGPADLRPLVRRMVRTRRVKPVLLAAPSQTRQAASGRTLWTPEGFDLASFVDATERNLRGVGVRVDRSRLAVVGHSGAGCYLAGGNGNGLFRVIRGVKELRRRGYQIQWVGFMDTCFFGGYGASWIRRALRGSETRVAAMWTGPEEWGPGSHRRVKEFARTLVRQRQGTCDSQRYWSCRTGADGWWVLAARRDALRRTFGDRSGEAQPISPHRSVTRWFMEELLTRWIPDEQDQQLRA